MYEPTWFGVPIIQLPEDIVQLQELIWRLKPDRIIETGIAHGGSLIFGASLLKAIGADGRILGIDIDIRSHNQTRLDNHPLRPFFELYEGDSRGSDAIDVATKFAAGAECVLVILDSGHSTAHVAAELELYSRLVTPGSYLVAMDGAQADAWDIPRGKPSWRNDNPLIAIRAFLKNHDEFEVDPNFTRMDITSSPEGYLRRRV